MRTAARAHYVGHNATTRVPKRYVYLDTESRRRVVGRREEHSWRLGVAAFDRPTKDLESWAERQWCTSTSTGELWEWITARCRRRARTVLVAHNLALDLRISNAFVELPRLGWTFKAGRVDDGQAWFVFTNDGRTLACVDSLSWVPVSLEKLGDLCGIAKLPLPEWEADDSEWFDRCRRDVTILADVWRRLMCWLVRDDLGNWRLSGAGQSWAAFRHRFMLHPLLVHEDDEARAAERVAAHTGRCEAWRHGQLENGPWTEWDFENAYARIAAECAVPVRLLGELRRATAATITVDRPEVAHLIDCTVTTDVPTVPCRTDTGIRWPVGTFRTTTWDHELRLALERGATVQVHRCWVYGRQPALEGFATWILDQLGSGGADVDPVVTVALKHWSRAFVGRTAARWSSWEMWGKSPRAEVGVSTLYDDTLQERSELMQLGHQLIRRKGAPDNPDAMAAVMSWIMAEARIRLWRAMETAGLANVAYVDTDSLIVNDAGSERLSDAAVPFLRVKGQWEHLVVLGPRQIVPDGRLRAAGVPSSSVQVGPNVWEGAVWSGLRTSFRHGQPAQVDIARRRFTLRASDQRRQHLSGGFTAAMSV